MAHEINLKNDNGTQKSLMELWSATFAPEGVATSPANIGHRNHTSDGHTQTEFTAFRIKKISSSYSRQYGDTSDRSSLYDSNTESADLNNVGATINVKKSFDAYSKIQQDFQGYTTMSSDALTFQSYTEGAGIDSEGSTRKLG